MIRATLALAIGTHFYYLIDTGNFLNLGGLIISVIGWLAYELRD